MFFFDLLVFSILIDNQYFDYVNNHSHKKNFLNIKNSLKISNNIENNKIGIVDFRYILKSSNAMKLLGNKFLTLEKEINEKIKQKQIFLKQKEENLKKNLISNEIIIGMGAGLISKWMNELKTDL